MLNARVCYVIVSCQKYSDLWPVMVHSIERNWPEVVKDLFILTDNPAPSPVRLIVVDSDISWSDNLIFLTDQLGSVYSHVFLMMEDGPFLEPVDHRRISKIFDEFFHSTAHLLLC